MTSTHTTLLEMMPVSFADAIKYISDAVYSQPTVIVYWAVAMMVCTWLLMGTVYAFFKWTISWYGSTVVSDVWSIVPLLRIGMHALFVYILCLSEADRHAFFETAPGHFLQVIWGLLCGFGSNAVKLTTVVLSHWNANSTTTAAPPPPFSTTAL
jgi:hypothetical protein